MVEDAVSTASSSRARRDHIHPKSRRSTNYIQKRVPHDTDGEQYSAPDELLFVSQPPGVALAQVPYYGYDSKAGEGIEIFIIDSGANPSNRDFLGMPVRPRWIWPPEKLWDQWTGEPGRPWSDVPMTEMDTDGGHGACAVSKAAGVEFGPAKKASIVVVPDGATPEHPAHISWLIYLCSRVRAEAMATRDEGRQVKAVLNLSWVVRTVRQEAIKALHRMIENLISLDVVVVVAANNDPVRWKAAPFQNTNLRLEEISREMAAMMIKIEKLG